MAIGRINPVVALTGFSCRKENVWVFHRDKKNGPNNEVTVRRGSTVLIKLSKKTFSIKISIVCFCAFTPAPGGTASFWERGCRGYSHIKRSQIPVGKSLKETSWAWFELNLTPEIYHLKRNRLNYQLPLRRGARSSRPDSKDRRKKIEPKECLFVIISLSST